MKNHACVNFFLAAFFLVFTAHFSAAPAYAQWKKAESEHFTVYSQDDEKGLRQFTTELEKFDILLRRLFNIADKDVAAKLKVVMVSNSEKLRGFYGGSSKYVAGFYSTRDKGAIAFSPYNDEGSYDFGLKAQEILFHEYVHHFMMQYFPAAYPAWFTEGIADFNSTIKFNSDNKVVFGAPVNNRLPVLNALGTMDLQSLFFDTSKKSDSLFYPTSWLLTHYLTFEKERQGQLNQYLTLINQGVGHNEAAQQAFGDIDRLSKDLRRYLKRGVVKTWVIGFDDFPQYFPMDITLLPADEDALFDEYFRIYLGEYDEDDSELLETLYNKGQQILEEYPDSAMAHYIIAESQFLQGQNSKALAHAEKAIAINDGQLDYHLLHADILMDMANESTNDAQVSDLRGQAKAAIIKANIADRDAARPLYYYYRLAVENGDPIGETEFQSIDEAWYRYPQNDKYRRALIKENMRKGEYAEAMTLIEPLINVPHGRVKKRDMALYEKLKSLMEEQVAGADQ